jgi:hypothetical protein
MMQRTISTSSGIATISIRGAESRRDMQCYFNALNLDEVDVNVKTGDE